MQHTHVMLDIETLGKGNNAAIISIGAAKFNALYCPETVEELLATTDTFHVRINLETALRFGRADASTVDWWMQEAQDEARHEWLKMPAVDFREALDGFSQWYGDDDSIPVWGNGATFDNVIMKSAYEVVGEKLPWSYKSDRCYRTLKSFAPMVKPVQVGIAHGALSDALSQAWHMQNIVHDLAIQV